MIVLAGTPRVGGRWLASLLAARGISPIVEYHGSPSDVPVGWRVHYEWAVAPLVGTPFIGGVVEGVEDARWVIQTRRDRRAQGESCARAQLTGDWSGPGKPLPPVSSTKARRLGEVFAHQEQGWIDLLARVDYLTVAYEDLLADPDAETTRVVAWLTA